MGYSNTTKLALRKDDGNESIVNWREHNNSNLDLLDTTVGNLVDAINNAKLLLGQLGYDQNGDPIVDADTARDTLDAAQSENAAGSLYDAEQAIGVNAGNIATNAAAISSLQDSVYQPDRMKNIKTNLRLVNLANPDAAVNQPGCVRASDASTITDKPSAIPDSGSFYALWDCYHMHDTGNHLLVELREMVPVPGRVWQNWYNWDHWTGWSCVASPSTSSFTIKAVSATIPNGTDNVTVSAPSVSGYHFLCWLQPRCDGWVGSLYMDPSNSTVKVWTSRVAQGTSGPIIKTGSLNIAVYALFVIN